MSDTTMELRQGVELGFLSWARIKFIAALALPILATMLTQNLMQVIDTAMIGQLGDSALAGVSLAGNQFFTLFSLLVGISASVQMMVARRMGEGNVGQTPLILNTGLILGVSIGIGLLLPGYFLLPWVINTFSPDAAVAAQANRYLFTIMPTTVIAGCAVAYSGYWIGLSKPLIGFFVLVVQVLCNATFNYALIFGHFGLPAMGIAGAGLGTTLANLVGVIIHTVLAIIHAGKAGFLRKLPEKQQVQTLIKIALPMNLQQFLFTLGITIFVFIVGALGTKALAAFQVNIVIMMTLFMMIMGLGSTATTLVSGSLGKREPDNAEQWAWEISTLGAGILMVLGVFFFIYAEDLLHLFIADSETVVLALIPLRIMIASFWIEGYGRVLAMALVGAGAIGSVFKINFINQWFVRLPLYWLIGIKLGYGLIGIFITMAVMYVVQTLLFINVWRNGHWREIRV